VPVVEEHECHGLSAVAQYTTVRGNQRFGGTYGFLLRGINLVPGYQVSVILASKMTTGHR
jgi:hypothetical protein